MSRLDRSWTLGEWIVFAVAAAVGTIMAISFIDSPESWWFVPRMLKP